MRSGHREKQTWWVRPAIWTFLSLGLLGVFVWLAFFREDCPPLLVFAYTDYPEPYLPNPWAREDLDLMKKLDVNEDDVVKHARIADGDDPGLSKCQNAQAVANLMARQWKNGQMRPGGPGRDIVLLYFNMHGVVDKGGDPCLVPPGVPAGDGKGWFSVKELLTHLLNDDNGLPKKYGLFKKNVQYVAIFDCNRIEADWSLGWLYNGFPERVGDVIRDLHNPNLHAIVSTSPDRSVGLRPNLAVRYSANSSTAGFTARPTDIAYATDPSNPAGGRARASHWENSTVTFTTESMTGSTSTAMIASSRCSSMRTGKFNSSPKRGKTPRRKRTVPRN